MPKLTKRLTDSVARKLEPPDAGYEMHWCSDTPGFGVRIGAPVGDRVARAWILERRVDGKTKRVTLGKAAGASAISAEAARFLMLERSSELQKGIDRAAVTRDKRKQEKAEATTLAEAVSEYVRKKRRSDGKPLKARTADDYLAMVTEGKTSRAGRKAADGELYTLANKSIHKISGSDMRGVYAAAMKRSERRAAYAMQVLRAVLNWFGVTVEDSPLGKEVAGRDRIVLPQPKARGLPIPPELIGVWWKAACAAGGDGIGGSQKAADSLRFALLTGARPGEGIGSKWVEGVLVRDVDLAGARVVLRDTKNRKDHVIMLSRQALEIVGRNAEGKKPTERLFTVGDPKKTLAAINKAAGVRVTPHGLRKTFVSVADALVTSNTQKKMVNHTDTRDVTATHYVFKGEAELRLGWQTVADFIESRASIEPSKAGENVVQMPAREVA